MYYINKNIEKSFKTSMKLLSGKSIISSRQNMGILALFHIIQNVALQNTGNNKITQNLICIISHYFTLLLRSNMYVGQTLHKTYTKFEQKLNNTYFFFKQQNLCQSNGTTKLMLR